MPPKPKPRTRKPATTAPKIKTTKAAVKVSLETAGLPEGAAAALPRGTVKLDPGGIKINVEKLSRSLMRDHRARLVSSMGCISNPGGPGC